MYGVQIAFKNFNAADGIVGVVGGVAPFSALYLSTYDFVQTLNTVLLSLYSIVVGFPFPIICWHWA